MGDERVQLVEELAANAWPAPVVQTVGGWRLRYGNGITRRTDSVLPNDHDERLPLADKLATVEDFYARRRAPARFQMTTAAAPDGLDGLLAARGYRSEGLVHVLAADLTEVLGRTAGVAAAPVEVAAEPTDGWFDIWFGVMASDPSARATARRILEQVGPVSGYATLVLDGTPVAVGRAVAERDWAGIFGMATLPAARRRGAATAVLASLAAWAQAHHARRLYLQVSSGNQDAERLYRRAGFATHHDYRYRTRRA